MNLLIRRLPQTKRRMLTDAHVEWCDMDGEVLIEESALEAALTAMNASERERKATDYDGIEESVLTLHVARAAVASEPAIEVRVLRNTDFGANTNRILEAAARTFGEQANKPSVTVYYGGRLQQGRGHDFTFCVSGRATVPRGQEYASVSVATVFGQPFASGAVYGCYTTTGERVPNVWPLLSPECVCVGTVCDDTAWLHAEITSRSAGFVRAYVNGCMEDAARFILESPEERDARWTTTDAAMENVQREVFLRGAVRSSVAAIQTEERAYAGAVEYVNSYRTELTRQLRAMSMSNARLIALRQMDADGDERKRLESEYAALTRIDHVRGIAVDGNCLVVNTEAMAVMDPRTGIMHALGSYRVLITMDGTGEIVFNPMGDVAGCPNAHPHIHGRPCWGTMAEAVSEYHASGEYAALVSMLVTFLQSVDVSDAWGHQVNEWPVLLSDGTVVRRGTRLSAAEQAIATERAIAVRRTETDSETRNAMARYDRDHGITYADVAPLEVVDNGIDDAEPEDECDRCGGYFHGGELVDGYCAECRELITTCIRCGTTVDIDDTNDGLCYSCHMDRERDAERARMEMVRA